MFLFHWQSTSNLPQIVGERKLVQLASMRKERAWPVDDFPSILKNRRKLRKLILELYQKIIARKPRTYLEKT